MDARLLEVYRVVMENQSMTGAAKVLGVTQPAVSTQISRLEAQIGFKLFERVGTRLKASEKGLRFYDEVIVALSVIDRLAETANVIQGGSSGTLVVASHPSASTSLVPSVISALLKIRPDTRVRLINRMSEDVSATFDNGGCDIGIAQWPISVAGADNRRYKVKTVAIMPKGHPLSEQPVIRASHFSGLPFIECSATVLTNHLIRNQFSASDAHYNPVIQSEYFGTICGLVGEGCGVSIVDPWTAANIATENIEIRPFEPNIFYEIAVFSRPTSRGSELANEFLRQLDITINGVDTSTLSTQT
jgi:DNA-binding transcriptional LysR family regulator